MKRISIFALFCLLLFPAIAQDAAYNAVKKDYPGLMSIYGDQLGSRHAHYIFAIDISSSMLPFEETVKKNFMAFVNALPDGDEVTLIRMAGTDQTDYVENCRSITINANTRANFAAIINSPQFQFIKGGEFDGSDGYKMAEKVIDAINVVGSNDLVFVYLFTDFEYWTKKNRYDKNKENWGALKKKLTKGQASMYKYGLELNFNNSSLKPQAIFKKDLDAIFGPIDYQGVSNAAFLSQWFSQLQASVMAAKLHSLVKHDCNEFIQSVQVRPHLSGEDVMLEVSSIESPIAQGLNIRYEGSVDDFIPSEMQQVGVGPQNVKIGTLMLKEKSWLPGDKIIGGGDASLKVEFIPKNENEIAQLEELLNDKILPSQENENDITLPSFEVWNCHIPEWIIYLAIAIFMVILLSILYTIFVIKFDKTWEVSVFRYDGDGNRIKEFNDQSKAPIELSSTVNKQQVSDWTFKLRGKKYNPLIFWKKTGYYLIVQSDSILTADLMDPNYRKDVKDTISTNKEVFVCSQRKIVDIILNLENKKNKYTIDLY